MILTNRLFERTPPTREARSIFIFCEGIKREYQYFEYFKEMDSRINVEIHKLEPNDDNSPKGLIEIAKNCIIQSEENPNPKYNFLDNDQVWIVLDSDKDKFDSRKSQIEEVREECDNNSNWYIVESNPCFEVWLYYHVKEENPDISNKEKCTKWKRLVNHTIPGGFQSKRHPIFLEEAIQNAEKNYREKDSTPELGSTQVFRLSKSILPLIKEKLDEVKKIL